MQLVSNKEMLAVELICSYKLKYEEIVKKSNNIEVKAQINVSITGILIAFVLTAVKDLKNYLDRLEIILILFSFFCLLLCIVLSIVTLLVKREDERPDYVILNDYYKKYKDNENNEEFRKNTKALYQTIMHCWNERIIFNLKQNLLKSRFVLVAQCLLLTSLFSILTLTCHFLLR